MDWTFQCRLYPLPYKKPIKDIFSRKEPTLTYVDIVNDNQHLRVSELKFLSNNIGRMINYALSAQYAKKKAKKDGVPYKPTARLKMLLTPSERSTIAYYFRKAKRAFDETQNKPHRDDVFSARRGPADTLRYLTPCQWSGHAARASIFQHHLAAIVEPESYTRPKVFRNDVYRPDHPLYPGRRPVPHLQIIDLAINSQYTKFTTEYPLVPVGRNWGGLPRAGSKGPARTLVSRVGAIHRFEGVVSHDTMDPYNHYLAIWDRHR
jgi:hypothetical protein